MPPACETNFADGAAADGNAAAGLDEFLAKGVRVAAVGVGGLLAFDKPAGLASHPNTAASGGSGGTAGARKTSVRALLNAPYSLDDECYELGGGRRIFLLNRIDSPTSGLVLAAGDAALANSVRALFRRHDASVRKTYLAIVKGGRLAPPCGSWRDKLAQRRIAGTVRSVAAAGGIPAVARYQWLAGITAPAPLSLLRLSPETGRTHQLRVQCAARARPILGDKTYGDFAFNRFVAKKAAAHLIADSATGGDCDFDRLFLHAHRLELHYEWQGRFRVFTATAPPPPEFTLFFPMLSAPLATN